MAVASCLPASGFAIDEQGSRGASEPFSSTAMATIKDVARLAGVSTATVSATVNDTAYVSPALKARVQQAVRSLGYAPSTVARSLKIGVTKLIGLIVPDITNPFFTELVHVLEIAAQKQGYTLLLCASDEDVAREIGILRTLQMQRVDGVILAPSGTLSDYRAAGLASYAAPLVLIDRTEPFFDADTVAVDNYAASLEATSHLIAHGHRRLATIAGSSHVSTGADRLRGFKDALGRAGLSVDERLIRAGNFRQSDAYAACKDLFAQPEPPTAIYIANNLMLVGAVCALADLGLACPDDISIVAMDDLPWMAAFSPKITVMRQPIRAMGEAVFEAMLRRLGAGGRKIESNLLMFKPDLVVRESCRDLVA
jgi:LacI family transcriptional regulator